MLVEVKISTGFERRKEKLVQIAETGKFSTTCEISEGELKKLRKEGLVVFCSGKKLWNMKIKCHIAWEFALNNETLDFWQFWYIHGERMLLPPTNNLAEELYLITRRAQVLRGL